MAGRNHTALGDGRVHTNGYVMERRASHPLADAEGRVYQHRRVLYDAIGAGPHQCHWCGAGVDWTCLHVDHLNEQQLDNRPGNLVPSCMRCNIARGLPKMRQAKKANGRLLTAHGMTMCVSDWSRHLGLARWTIMGRLARGIAPEEALCSERARCGPARRRMPRPEYVVQIGAPAGQENAP